MLLTGPCCALTDTSTLISAFLPCLLKCAPTTKWWYRDDWGVYMFYSNFLPWRVTWQMQMILYISISRHGCIYSDSVCCHRMSKERASLLKEWRHISRSISVEGRREKKKIPKASCNCKPRILNEDEDGSKATTLLQGRCTCRLSPVASIACIFRVVLGCLPGFLIAKFSALVSAVRLQGSLSLYFSMN